MCANAEHFKKLKIRIRELREAADAAELNRFFQDRKGVVNVEMNTDLFTAIITFDERETSPDQILAALHNVRFSPEGSIVLNK